MSDLYCILLDTDEKAYTCNSENNSEKTPDKVKLYLYENKLIVL